LEGEGKGEEGGGKGREGVGEGEGKEEEENDEEELEANAFDHIVVRQSGHGQRVAQALLAQANILRYHPARTFQRIIAASVFILKAIILGIQSIKVSADIPPIYLLNLLEETVQLLKISAIDETHLAAYYAVILERHICSLRPRELKDAKSLSVDCPLADTQAHNDQIWHDFSNNPFDQFDLVQEFLPKYKPNSKIQRVVLKIFPIRFYVDEEEIIKVLC
jgi:hypothetical protein